MAVAKERPSAPSSDNARRAAMRRALRDLTQRYVSDVMSLFQDALLLEAASAASLRETDAPRRPRRDLKRLDAVAEDVVHALAGGLAMSVSQLATAVGTVPQELTHPIARLVRQGKLIQHGERKGTRYTLAKRRAATAKTKASAKRSAKPKRSAETKPKRSAETKPAAPGRRDRARRL